MTVDGVLQNVYRVSFKDPIWFGYVDDGNTGFTSVGVAKQWLRLMFSTDSSMSNTSIQLVNSLWFKDHNGHIQISGSWSYACAADKYDVDNDGSKTDKFSIAGAAKFASLSITIVPQ
jgi:hypothetical protein